ncbi:MAG: CPBP family intramembrane metalloprotease [Pirellulales bacterium]|nr:CPBP family intramembrane metalloprotease [Pirellulales bacterium]
MPTDAPPQAVPHFARRYWSEARRPWISLVFIAPMLIAYELGVWFFNEQTGVDVWMKGFLNALGFSQHLLPVITAGILLGWHYLIREKWRFSAGVLSAMVIECLVLAIALQVLSLMFLSSPGGDHALRQKLQEALVYFGTGVYEELLFRLILFSALWWLLRFFWPQGRKGMLIAMLASAVVFSLAHFIGPGRDTFSWPYLVFLFLAGIFFAAVFVYRGFGIAAGTHALYDILVCMFTT